jgi:hypothetical protein
VEYGFVGLVIATAIIVGAQFRPADILPSNGTLQIRITDDPLTISCPSPRQSVTFTSLNVTLSSIEAHWTGALSLTDRWMPVPGAPTAIDILQLRNVNKLLGSISVPEGTVTSIRLNVSSAVATSSTGTPHEFVISSGKLEVSLASNGEVRSGMTTSVVVDFQPHVVCEGTGTFRLTPVLTATSRAPE